jgi:hypothetical protein
MIQNVRPEPRNESDGEYNLKITTTLRPRLPGLFVELRGTNYECKINEFLDSLFPTTEGSPLSYAKHSVQDGAVLVRATSSARRDGALTHTGLILSDQTFLLRSSSPFLRSSVRTATACT